MLGFSTEHATPYSKFAGTSGVTPWQNNPWEMTQNGSVLRGNMPKWGSFSRCNPRVLYNNPYSTCSFLPFMLHPNKIRRDAILLATSCTYTTATPTR